MMEINLQFAKKDEPRILKYLQDSQIEYTDRTLEEVKQRHEMQMAQAQEYLKAQEKKKEEEKEQYLQRIKDIREANKQEEDIIEFFENQGYIILDIRPDTIEVNPFETTKGKRTKLKFNKYVLAKYDNILDRELIEIAEMKWIFDKIN